MRLIEQYEIEIPEEKIVSYLLSSTHRIGNHKAEFFSKIGYSQTNWKEFQKAIIILVENCDAHLQKENHFGKIFRVEGTIKTPLSKDFDLRTAWMVKTNSNVARFITAYPI